MNLSTKRKRKVAVQIDRHQPPFIFHQQQLAAVDEFTQLAAKQVEAVRDNYVSADNNLKYSHGNTWQTDYPDSFDNQGEFREFSTETNTRFDDVINHNVAGLVQNLQDLVHGICDQFVKSLFGLITETTDRTGNVVSKKIAGSSGKAFLAALEKIEFGVDRNGNVTLPTVHTGQDPEKMVAELKAEGPELSKKVDEIIAEKSKAALAREAERRAKFLLRE